MAVKVKICGVRSAAIADAAIAAGADYLGLVFFENSSRNLRIEEGASLVEAVAKRVPTVAVLVDPDDALIDAVVSRVGADYLQLHGNESPERVAAIKVRSARPIIKALPVSGQTDIGRAGVYAEIADMILYDTKAPIGAASPGGTGLAFDWTLLSGADVPRPLGLSGGLHEGNVARAIGIADPDLVDVSSGVERAPGVKDAALIRAFIAEARIAEAAKEDAVS